MDAIPTASPASADPAREALEDLVYRPMVGEGTRAARGASPWVTAPVTLALLALGTGLTAVLGGRAGAGRTAQPSIGLVLQEPLEPQVHAAPGGAPAPPPTPMPRPAPPAPALAPPPEVAPKPAAVLPPSEDVPEVAPKELPREDHSRDFGGSAGSGPGVPGGTGSGSAGSGTGTGSGAGSGAPSKVVDVEFSQVRMKDPLSRPPYPQLAHQARIQGNVVVEITVGTDGLPVKVRALEGPNLLRAAAEAYARTLKFYPYLLNGTPQISRFTLTVEFRLT